jgi:thiol-disulfide isomerase/thioredoxin
MRILIALLVSTIFFGCDSEKKNSPELQTGMWRAAIMIQGQELPFNLEVTKDSTNGYDAFIINASEKILLDEIRVSGDSVDIALHVFDANIKAIMHGDSLTGTFIKNYEKDYRVPFRAKFGQAFRFEKGEDENYPDFNGQYAVTFTSASDTVPAVGVFTQVKDSVTGTFLTETGDYRFLQGNVANGVMQLSTFDGNHSYLFKAILQSDGTLSGKYWSGKTYLATWIGEKNDKAELKDPESLTYLKPGYEKIEFSFPDVNGKTVTLNDEKYKGKVVVLQLFGSWCPNCMDETKFLSPWYSENQRRGVEVIGLAYERKADFGYASARVKKMIDKFDVTYNFLIAGTNDKAEASKTLPQLNRVVAFPTTIFIGKDGKVKKIHTGFSGPGTGIYYDQFVQEFNETINELLGEKIAFK